MRLFSVFRRRQTNPTPWNGTHPYDALPPRAYWKTGVADQTAAFIPHLYRKKFDISPTDKIATMGSCFAQHIGARLKSSGYRYVDLEPPPLRLPEARQKEFGYGIYSARYGNVYTVRQLLQLIDRAYGRFTPHDSVWEAEGRYFDPFRPTMEPNGFSSPEEVRVLHEKTMLAVRQIVEESDVIVFTLGLTEAWVSRSDGAVYPVCPGTTAGRFNPSSHEFRNFTFSEIMRDLEKVISIVARVNPSARWVLTVSPVPLTATASGDHVLAATTYSKSILRAVAGEVAQRHACVDYFPSYEIITGPQARSLHYHENLRTVTADGVDSVMRHFFAEHPVLSFPDEARTSGRQKNDDDIVCEEGYLEKWASA
ncbi:GSCFA domain-containing protein [Sinorhizobium meliloti]|uniref:GSCFA domain-containing protein n=1 Tax=Rhizobium meliloti TaxID=382 RepID=UPI001F1AE06E|nr:GSCFA domain-containing protein [Sinorhizobium meliloti]